MRFKCVVPFLAVFGLTGVACALTLQVAESEALVAEVAAEADVEPAADEPVVEEPAVGEAADQGPVAEPAAEGEAADQDADEPASDEPPAEEPAEAAADAREQPDEAAAEEEAAPGFDWGGVLRRFPAFAAVLHRAAIHIPIALWLLGALYVLIGLVFPKWRNQIPVVCLVVGSMGAIGAAATGWWNAEYEFLGEAWTWQEPGFSLEEDLDKHRWAGVGLAAASVVLSVLALISQAKKSKSLGVVWRVGLLLLAAGVAWEGHLGGEMLLGEYLEEAWEALINPEA